MVILGRIKRRGGFDFGDDGLLKHATCFDVALGLFGEMFLFVIKNQLLNIEQRTEKRHFLGLGGGYPLYHRELCEVIERAPHMLRHFGGELMSNRKFCRAYIRVYV